MKLCRESSHFHKHDLLFGSQEEHIIFQFIHVPCLHALIVHLPEHWFHMVLETGYKHLRHQMKSVSECSPLVYSTSPRLKPAVQYMLDTEKGMLDIVERNVSCLLLQTGGRLKSKDAVVWRRKLSCIFSPLPARWPILQMNSRGCGYIASHSQTSDPARNVKLMKFKGIFL